MKTSLKEMEKIVGIADAFNNFIDERSFGFCENHSLVCDKIVRYDEGIQKISEITGISIRDLEQKKCMEIDDNDIVDVRFELDDIAFEYSFVGKDDDEINATGGWWKLFYINDGFYEDVYVLFDKYTDMLFNEDEEDEN